MGLDFVSDHSKLRLQWSDKPWWRELYVTKTGIPAALASLTSFSKYWGHSATRLTSTDRAGHLVHLIVKSSLFQKDLWRIPSSGWAVKTNDRRPQSWDNNQLFPTVLEAGSPPSRSQQIPYLLRALFLISRWLSSCCVLTRQRAERKLAFLLSL